MRLWGRIECTKKHVGKDNQQWFRGLSTEPFSSTEQRELPPLRHPEILLHTHCRIPAAPLRAEAKQKRDAYLLQMAKLTSKKKKNITETKESSSSTFIAAIQRFNNATKGLLTLKGVWGGRGEMLGFFLGT